MYSARSNYFIGFEIDEQQAVVAMANVKRDPRTRVFPHAFLIKECTPVEIAGVRSFFRTSVLSTSCILHYLNNFNFRMSDLRKIITTLEAKLVTKLAKEEKQRRLDRAMASQKYAQAEVLVTLHPVPRPSGWTFTKIPFEFSQEGMAFSWAPGCLSGYCYKYLAPAPEFVENDLAN